MKRNSFNSYNSSDSLRSKKRPSAERVVYKKLIVLEWSSVASAERKELKTIPSRIVNVKVIVKVKVIFLLFLARLL